MRDVALQRQLRRQRLPFDVLPGIIGASELHQLALRRGLGAPGAILFPGMYARKLKVEIIVGGERRPCPLDWLDSFCMRNFTGAAEFDDTLPTGDGALEASLRVDPERLAAALAAWLTQRGKGNGQPVHVEIHAALKPG